MILEYDGHSVRSSEKLEVKNIDFTFSPKKVKRGEKVCISLNYPTDVKVYLNQELSLETDILDRKKKCAVIPSDAKSGYLKLVTHSEYEEMYHEYGCPIYSSDWLIVD